MSKRDRASIFGERTVQLNSIPFQNISNQVSQVKTPQSNISFFQFSDTITQNDHPTKISTDYTFQEQNIPKITCFYHPEFTVKNFCTNFFSECLMPLCPACIKVHQFEHQSNNTPAQFELLEVCLTRNYHNLAIKANTYVEDLEILQQFINSVQNAPQIQKEKLIEAKQKCYKMIDTYFEMLEKEVSTTAVSNVDELQMETQKISQSVQRQWKGVIALLQKLNSEKCLKTLIKCSSRNILNEAQQSSLTIQQFIDQHKSSLQEINIDQSQLYQISLMLSKYVNFKQSASPVIVQNTQNLSPNNQNLVTIIPGVDLAQQRIIQNVTPPRQIIPQHLQPKQIISQQISTPQIISQPQQTYVVNQQPIITNQQPIVQTQTTQQILPAQQILVSQPQIQQLPQILQQSYNKLQIGTGQGQVINLPTFKNNQQQIPLLNYNMPIYQPYEPLKMSPLKNYSPGKVEFSPKITMS